MKHIYPFATMLLAVILLSGTISAQTYSGGTYTAQRSGNWTGNIWNPSQPPNPCINCLIVIASSYTVTLNTSITLQNSSLLVIGTDNTTPTELVIPGSSTTTNWSAANNVLLLNDNSNPANSIKLLGSSDVIDASGANTLDGILVNSPNPSGPGTNLYSKMVGNSPSQFLGTTPEIFSAATYGPTINGGSSATTLSAIGTLPILLSAFNAVLNDNQVDLTWTTSLETNSDHFAIERSTDAGTHWTTIGTVAAQDNSSVTVNYSYTDANPASGVSEYRLQLVDRDGKYAYSTIEVIRAVVGSTIKIFPNPAKDFAYITFGGESATGDLTVRLITQSGQLLTEKRFSNAGGTTVALSVSSYPQGNYLIQTIRPDGTQQINKLLISK